MYTNYIPQVGDLFEWCEEHYWCIESNKYYGTVNPMGQTYYLRNFFWYIGDDKPVFIRKATDSEMAKFVFIK